MQKLAEFERTLLQQSAWGSLTSAEELNQINESEDLERYSLSQPDLVISIRHMSILKPTAIAKAKAKYGAINLHSGMLPKYRGAMATFWALHNTEQNIGTTLHFIDDANIDTGRIIAQSKAVARFDQSYLWNVLNVYRAGCDNVLRAIDTITQGESPTISAQTGEANYYTFPTQEILNDFIQPLFNTTDTLSQFSHRVY